MKRLLFFIPIYFSMTLIFAQGTDTLIHVLDYKYSSAYVKKAENKADSVLTEWVEIEFPQKVKIVGISFYDQGYKQALLEQLSSSDLLGPKLEKTKKMVITSGSAEFDTLIKSNNIYLMDSEGLFYRVDLPGPSGTLQKVIEQKPDPKMIFRNPKTNQPKKENP